MRLCKMFHNSALHEVALTCLMTAATHALSPVLSLEVLSCFLESFSVESANVYTKYCSLVGIACDWREEREGGERRERMKKRD